MARRGSALAPSPEKLSGVTLTTPITSGRSVGRPAKGVGRWASACIASCQSSGTSRTGPTPRSSPSSIRRTKAKAMSPPCSGRANPSRSAWKATGPVMRPRGSTKRPGVIGGALPAHCPFCRTRGQTGNEVAAFRIISVGKGAGGLEHGHELPDQLDPGRIIWVVAGRDDHLVDQGPCGLQHVPPLPRIDAPPQPRHAFCIGLREVRVQPRRRGAGLC